MTKLNKLENYLARGCEATPTQIKKMFGISNPSAAIHTLRSRGLCVFANEATLKSGEKTTKYRVGVPTRSMVRTLHSLGYFGR